jgi:Biopolymer transport protein ExbD/TolR
MITWTETARALLEKHNRAVRVQRIATNADHDRVAAELKRQIEKELVSANIGVVTRDDILRILARMGSPILDTRVAKDPLKAIQSMGPWAVLVLAAIAVTVTLFVSHIFIGQWGRFLADRSGSLDPSKQGSAASAYAIDVVTKTPEWGQFQPGDSIVVSSVKSDRKNIEVGGTYLVEGSYVLSSMDSAGLSLSVTAQSPDSPGAVAPVQPAEKMTVHRGNGRFRLRATMRYPGSFHVSFNPPGGGSSRGTVYFSKVGAPAPETPNPGEAPAQMVVSVDDGGLISLNGKTVADAQLGPLLIQAKGTDPNTTVLIKVDAATPQERISFAMDSCRKAALTRFSLQSR